MLENYARVWPGVDKESAELDSLLGTPIQLGGVVIQVLASIMIMAAPAPADTVTGCLQKGQQAGTYSLTSKDGKTYSVTSKSVKLDGHVGHTVTLTGAENKDAMSVSATKLAMVAASCS
jgi:hypothetical protein